MTYVRFGTRDLLWAMAVVGLAMGWLLDRHQLVSQTTQMRTILNALTQNSGQLEIQATQDGFTVRSRTGGTFMLGPVK